MLKYWKDENMPEPIQSTTKPHDRYHNGELELYLVWPDWLLLIGFGNKYACKSTPKYW